jgi:hypothetical protein
VTLGDVVEIPCSRCDLPVGQGEPQVNPSAYDVAQVGTEVMVERDNFAFAYRRGKVGHSDDLFVVPPNPTAGAAYGSPPPSERPYRNPSHTR